MYYCVTTTGFSPFRLKIETTRAIQYNIFTRGRNTVIYMVTIFVTGSYIYNTVSFLLLDFNLNLRLPILAG
jgi:hypothetical protein